MLHVKPLNESEVTENVIVIYRQIQKSFHLDTTPLFFEYLGGFPDFLEFLWEGVKRNVEDSQFETQSQTCVAFTRNQFSNLYKVPKAISPIISDLFVSIESKKYVQKKCDSLFYTNAQIVLFFIAIRESIKGWAVESKLLTDKFDLPNFQRVTSLVEEEVESSIIEAPKELQTIEASFEFDFMRCMALVQGELDDFTKDEKCLFARVELERFLISQIDKIPHSLQLSYRSLSRYAEQYKYFDELAYLLYDSFPTIAVRRLIASYITDVLLQKEEKIILKAT